MDRPLEEQIRALAERNLSKTGAVEGDGLDDYAPSTTPTRPGRRPLAFAVAAMVLVLAGIGLLALTQRDSPDTVASGDTFGLIPPADATDVSGVLVDGGSGLDFTVDGRAYHLTQAGGGFLSPDRLEEMMATSGAQVVEVDGVGVVYVQCAAALEPAGPGEESEGTPFASWLDGPVFFNMLVDGDDPGSACRPNADGSTPLIEVVRSLRPVSETEWQTYVTTNGFQDFTGPRSPEKQCLSAGSGEVCAERVDSVLITASGLQPGSTVSYAAEGAGRPDMEAMELTVTDEGGLPGAIGLISIIPAPVTITISATSADGQPLTGSLVVP